MGLADYLPLHAWIAVGGLATIAVSVFFVPASIAATLGLSIIQFILLAAAIELCAAVGIGAIVVYYSDPDWEPPEWRFDP